MWNYWVICKKYYWNYFLKSKCGILGQASDVTLTSYTYQQLLSYDFALVYMSIMSSSHTMSYTSLSQLLFIYFPNITSKKIMIISHCLTFCVRNKPIQMLFSCWIFFM